VLLSHSLIGELSFLIPPSLPVSLSHSLSYFHLFIFIYTTFFPAFSNLTLQTLVYVERASKRVWESE
jgi:hypothetical protein